jgi:hypothetical protein
MSDEWIFVIDTADYAGNFEREMCAFITGQVGECGVGEDAAEEARADLPKKVLNWFDQNVIERPDDHGCHRPCSIWPTQGYFNDGLGNEYKEDANPESVKAQYKTSLNKLPKESQDNIKSKGPGRYPSYQSVAIFLSASPTEAAVATMEKRALEYAGKEKKYGTKQTILGFRLIQEVTTEKILYERKIKT